MLPLKWKIYRLINFVQLFFGFIFFALLCWYLIDTDFPFPDLLFLFPAITVGCNCYLNLHILKRFFPDRVLTDKLKNFSTILFVLNIFVGLGLMGIMIIGAESEFRLEGENDPTGKIMLAVLAFIWIILVYILILQSEVPGFLKNNNRNKMEKLIDSIGHSG